MFRLNQYAPIQDLKALIKNDHIAWPYRLIWGLPTTLFIDVLLPGRVFPWGDYYNSFTNTAHLYSNDPTIAMHEAGHAYDFADFPYKGTYTVIRSLPLVDLYQEKRATEEAIDYLIEINDRPMELRAYRKLWPAYGTYVGNYFRIPMSSWLGALGGHALAHLKVETRVRYYQRMDAVLNTPKPSASPSKSSTALSPTITNLPNPNDELASPQPAETTAVP